MQKLKKIIIEFNWPLKLIEPVQLAQTQFETLETIKGSKIIVESILLKISRYAPLLFHRTCHNTIVIYIDNWWLRVWLKIGK